jgi:hypothetical protein
MKTASLLFAALSTAAVTAQTSLTYPMVTIPSGMIPSAYYTPQNVATTQPIQSLMVCVCARARV